MLQINILLDDDDKITLRYPYSYQLMLQYAIFVLHRHSNKKKMAYKNVRTVTTFIKAIVVINRSNFSEVCLAIGA